MRDTDGSGGIAVGWQLCRMQRRHTATDRLCKPPRFVASLPVVHTKRSALRSGHFYREVLPTMYDAGIITQERFAELMVRGVVCALVQPRPPDLVSLAS